DHGWIGIANRGLLKATVSALRSRKGETSFYKVKGHSGEIGNDGADAEAAKGAVKGVEDQLNLTIPNEWNITGAKLASMTQAFLYKGINETPKREVRQRGGTIVNPDKIRYAIKDAYGNLPTNGRIWRSQRKKEISKNIRAYIWKATHNAYKCGSYWENIPGYEPRATCPICNVEESMEHILTECQASGQETLWTLTRKLWEKKGHEWPVPKFGLQLGCGLADFKNDDKRDQSANRLYTILMSETTHLIWKTRCEWRITREEDRTKLHTQRELSNKWKHAINQRLRLDCLMADARRYGSKATSNRLMHNTWKKTLLNEQQLPDD
ncbi:hypothetical protein BD779DRAFT_1459335, partial [Infundibulicybe gibba]